MVVGTGQSAASSPLGATVSAERTARAYALSTEGEIGTPATLHPMPDHDAEMDAIAAEL
jgi:hypothetical protein